MLIEFTRISPIIVRVFFNVLGTNFETKVKLQSKQISKDRPILRSVTVLNTEIHFLKFL